MGLGLISYEKSHREKHKLPRCDGRVVLDLENVSPRRDEIEQLIALIELLAPVDLAR